MSVSMNDFSQFIQYVASALVNPSFERDVRKDRDFREPVRRVLYRLEGFQRLLPTAAWDHPDFNVRKYLDHLPNLSSVDKRVRRVGQCGVCSREATGVSYRLWGKPYDSNALNQTLSSHIIHAIAWNLKPKLLRSRRNANSDDDSGDSDSEEEYSSQSDSSVEGLEEGHCTDESDDGDAGEESDGDEDEAAHGDSVWDDGAGEDDYNDDEAETRIEDIQEQQIMFGNQCLVRVVRYHHCQHYLRQVVYAIQIALMKMSSGGVKKKRGKLPEKRQVKYVERILKYNDLILGLWEQYRLLIEKCSAFLEDSERHKLTKQKFLNNSLQDEKDHMSWRDVGDDKRAETQMAMYRRAAKDEDSSGQQLKIDSFLTRKTQSKDDDAGKGKYEGDDDEYEEEGEEGEEAEAAEVQYHVPVSTTDDDMYAAPSQASPAIPVVLGKGKKSNGKKKNNKKAAQKKEEKMKKETPKSKGKRKADESEEEQSDEEFTSQRLRGTQSQGSIRRQLSMEECFSSQPRKKPRFIK